MLLMLRKIVQSVVVNMGLYFSDDAQSDAYYFDDALTQRYDTSD
jgi:hypothetical protein